MVILMPLDTADRSPSNLYPGSAGSRGPPPAARGTCVSSGFDLLELIPWPIAFMLSKWDPAAKEAWDRHLAHSAGNRPEDR